MKISIDSNCLTYLTEVVEPNYDPQNDDQELALQRLSMLRLFFYHGNLNILPSVQNELEKIPDKEKLKSTLGMAIVSSAYLDAKKDNELDYQEIYNSAFAKHPKEPDCKIYTESILNKMDYLVTFDKDFKRHLTDFNEGIKILFPSELIKVLGIKKESPLKNIPDNTNPLFGKSFWMFE